MPITGLALLTRCWHHPGTVEVKVCETPFVSATVEVKPEIRGTVPPEVQGPAGTPKVVAGIDLKPEIRRTSGEEQSTGSSEPTVLSAGLLAPVIRKAEEE